MYVYARLEPVLATQRCCSVNIGAPACGPTNPPAAYLAVWACLAQQRFLSSTAVQLHPCMLCCSDCSPLTHRVHSARLTTPAGNPAHPPTHEAEGRTQMMRSGRRGPAQHRAGVHETQPGAASNVRGLAPIRWNFTPPMMPVSPQYCLRVLACSRCAPRTAPTPRSGFDSSWRQTRHGWQYRPTNRPGDGGGPGPPASSHVNKLLAMWLNDRSVRVTCVCFGFDGTRACALWPHSSFRRVSSPQ